MTDVADPQAQSIAWDLSDLLDGAAGTDDPAAAVDALLAEAAGARRRLRRRPQRQGRRARRRRVSSPPCASSASCRSCSAAPAPTRCCASRPTPPTPPAARCCSGCRSRARRSRPGCCSSTSSGRRSTTSSAEELLATEGLGLLPPPPAHRAPLPAAPALRARGEDPHREGAHAAAAPGPACSRSRPRPSRSTLEDGGEPVALEVGALPPVLARPRGAPHGRRARHRGARARPAHARVHLQHAARRQGGRRPAAPLPALAGQPQPRQRGLRRVGRRRSSRRCATATSCRGAGTALKARLLGLDRLADYDRMAAVADARGARSAGRAPATSCSTPTRSFSPELGDVVRRFFDERVDRRARAPGQARRRVLRLHGAVRAPLRAAQLHGAAPRRR